MNRDTVLVVLTVVGSALCWWPLMAEPNLHFNIWLVPMVVGLIAGLATALSYGVWLRFVFAAVAGAFAGLCAGFFVLFPSSDGIANSYAPILIALSTLVAGAVALIACLVGRRLLVSSRVYRRRVWVALLCLVASGPAALAVTSPLVAKRTANDDLLAAQRFEALRKATEQTVGKIVLGRVCDGKAVLKYYAGPPFSDEDWRRITGNYVTEDRYSFMIYCQEQGGFTIHAIRSPVGGYSERQFCVDESGKMSCGMTWNRSRHVCTSCAK